MMQQLNTLNAPRALGPYSQAMICDNFLYCSGQLPLDPATMKLVGHDIIPQARQVLENMGTILRSAQLDLSDVVKMTIYLNQLADFERVNQLLSQEFGEHRPACSILEVSRLPLDALIEIDCVARLRWDASG